MAEFYFPAAVGVQDEAITLVDDATAVFRPQYTRGAIQTQSFGGPRLKLQRKCFVSGPDRGILFAWLAQVRGKQNPFWTNINYKMQGSFPAVELFANPDFKAGTASWSAQNCTISARAGILRLVRTAANFGVSQSLSVATGPSYALRGIMRSGKSSLCGVNGSATSEYALSTARVSTLVCYPITGVIQAFPVVFDAGGSAMANGDFGECVYASLQVCAEVSGAGQTGSSLTIDSLPASTAGLAFTGDIVEVNRQLVILTSDLNSNGSGVGVLQFEPELISSPPDDDAVIFGKPLGKFILASDPQIMNQFGLYATVTFDMEQVY